MNKKLISIIQYLLGLGIGGGLMYLAFKDIEPAQIQKALTQLHSGWMLLAVGVMIGAHVFRGWRWQMMLRAAGYPTANTINCSAAVLFGYLVNNAVPRLGEIARCSILVRASGIPLATGAGTVVTERVFDVIVLAGMLGIAVLLETGNVLRGIESWNATQTAATGNSPINWLLWAAGSLFVIIIVLFLIFRKRFSHTAIFINAQKFMLTLGSAALSVRKLERPFLFWVATAGIWLGYIGATWLTLLAYEPTSHFSFYFAFLLNTLGALGMILPAPGGLGPYHVAIIFTFKIFGYSQEMGMMVALILHTPQLIGNTILGAFGYLWLIFQTPPATSEVLTPVSTS
jgi:uncharacterized protein (TIRG00374 family)